MWGRRKQKDYEIARRRERIQPLDGLQVAQGLHQASKPGRTTRHDAPQYIDATERLVAGPHT
ncbi:hypothetical protein D3C87_2189770 [compost metagenome]